MRNPYDDEQDLTEYRVSRRAALGISAIFLLILCLLPLGDLVHKVFTGHLTDSPLVTVLRFDPTGEQKLQQHLAGVDCSLDQLPYAKALRQHTQQLFTTGLGEGNRKVVLGRNGWLFYRPELQALNGWGPLKKEPFSVMKDPTLAQLKPAREWVLQFAAELKSRGIPLLLVPVPVKPMLYPEQLFNRVPDGPLYHPDQLAFYDELREAGIEVLDLAGPLYELKKRFPLFLKQDTHWTPEAMKRAAVLVAEQVKKAHPELVDRSAVPPIDPRVHDRKSLGDLVELLDLPDAAARFKAEPAQIVALEGLDSDRSSPITLLGDSFVNIYTDPTLGFADPSMAEQDPPPLMKAGFGYQLALHLARPLDVIAKNGAGTTATRKEFAARPDDVVRSKKLVIWVLAARDLLYSPAAARDANIEWGPAPFNPHSSKPKPDGTLATTTAPNDGQIVVEAELIEKSANQDPIATPYADALHTAVYRVNKVVSGEFDAADEWQAVQWTFKKKVLQPPAHFSPGRRYRLTLSPWDDQAALQILNLRNDNTSLDEFTTERWYVEAAQEIP